jgi:hypothetical protein
VRAALTARHARDAAGLASARDTFTTRRASWRRCAPRPSR